MILILGLTVEALSLNILLLATGSAFVDARIIYLGKVCDQSTYLMTSQANVSTPVIVHTTFPFVLDWIFKKNIVSWFRQFIYCVPCETNEDVKPQL